MGLAFAFRLARAMGRVDDAAVAAVEETLDAAALPRTVPPAVARRSARLMRYDKKRAAGGALRWVLPRGRGGHWVVEWDVPAEGRALRRALAEIEAEP